MFYPSPPPFMKTIASLKRLLFTHHSKNHFTEIFKQFSIFKKYETSIKETKLEITNFFTEKLYFLSRFE